jgi:indole-3-glycerol phosphate synthase
MFLEEVIISQQKRVKILKKREAFFKAKLKRFPRRDFTQAISQPGRLNIIAEIKKASPSKGIITAKLPLSYLSIIYDNFAQAISVLTEPRWFKGNIEYLGVAKTLSRIPILRKDFIIDEIQIYQARCYGADAVLLIVRILTPAKLKALLTLTQRLKMAALVEVHTLKELEVALKSGAKIIGVNNRNLATLQVEPLTFGRIYPYIPKDKIIIAESGYQSRADLLPLVGKAHAVLIGSSIMQAADPRAKLKSLTGL